VGVAGPLLGVALGVLIALHRRRWLAGLATGAFVGSLIGLSAGSLLFTVAMLQARLLSQLACLTYSADGRRMVSGSHTGQVVVWDAATGEPIWEVDGHPGFSVFQAVFRADGERVASAGADGSVRVWDAGSGRAIVTLRDRGPGLPELAFSTDGKCLAGAFQSGLIRVWDLQTGQEVRSVPFPGGLGSVFAFSPDRKRLAAFGREGMRVVSGFWDP
jgi:WD40 repeat protein